MEVQNSACLDRFRAILTSLMMLCFASSALAQTTINAISADPDPFNVDRTDTTGITVLGTPGQTNLAVRIFLDDQVTVVRGAMALTETATAGTYTVDWNGRNDSNQDVDSGSYRMRVYNLSTTTDIGPYEPITVTRMADTIDYTPRPFTPDGTAEVTFTVTGEPNAADLEIYFYESGERRFP